MSPRILLIALAGLAPGCASFDEPAIQVATANLECEDIVCGNAAALDDHPFWELDQSKAEYSPEGRFKIKSFTSAGGVALKLRVDKFMLLGINGLQVFALGGLVGSKLVIERELGPEYEMTLQAVGTIPYVELGNVPNLDPPIPTYRWTYRVVGGNTFPVRFLCANDSIYPGEKDAIMFAGDRYSKATGTVIRTGPAADPWFNIACNDAALWKMAVFRHVEAARRLPVFDTDRRDRTAAIRAIRADYCGNNVAWTDTGTAVDWANKRHWLTINHALYPDVEAIWDENGAICLSEPRLYDFNEIDCWPDWQDHLCTDEQIANWDTVGRMITYVP